MRAEVKLLMGAAYEPDPYGDRVELESFKPIDPTNFGIDVQALIGTPGNTFGDSFDIVVCSPSWLAANWTRPELSGFSLDRGVRACRDIWLMATWDFEALQGAVANVLGQASAKNWGDLANRIGRFLPWEYEYRYDDQQDDRAEK